MRVDAPSRTSGTETAQEVLRLLRGGASVAEYRRLLNQADPEVRALVDDALKTRRVMEELRRREAELAALYETAGDLSSLRDLEAVLQAIVRRARGLLHTDAAYMMVNDKERGDTYMRVTDGIHTDGFKHARLDLGAGLGGLVAKTATPYSTADYFSDERFVHTVDAVVRGEGLIAIQGAPLKLREQVIGVLFAANRHVRPFSDAEVALLISLADHAAIAIENASLFQDVQRTVEELTKANELIQAHSQSIERAAALHERLTTIVLGGGGMADVAEILAEALGGGILVLDARGRTIAAAGDDPLVAEARETGALPHSCSAARAVREACKISADSRRSWNLPRTSISAPACVTPIVAGSEVLGALLLIRAHIDASDVRAVERAALVNALILLNERSVAEAEHRMRGEILDDLLAAPHRDLAGLQRRAALLGLDLDRPYTLLAARCRDGQQRRRIADAAAAATGGLAGEYRGNVVVLLPGGEDPGAAARSLAASLSRAVEQPVTVGAATASPGAPAIAEAHQAAARCLDMLLSLDRDGQGATPDELGVYGLLFNQAGRDELDRFIQQRIGRVLDYDARRGGDLERTLRTYFQCDGNLARTAATMYIHVNTLYQRIERVSELLGQDWRHGDHALQIHLALKLHAVMSDR